MAPISKRIAGAGVSGITQKQCARCSAKVKKDAFCPHCRKFFQELSKPDPALATTVHGAKRHSPPSDMSRGRTGKHGSVVTGGHSEIAEHKDEQAKGPAGLPGRPTVDSL